MNKKNIKLISRLFIAPIVIGIIFSIILYAYAPLWGWSCIKGVAIMLLANLFFAYRFFRIKQGKFEPKQLLVGLLVGEGGKFIILIVGVMLAALFGQLNWLALIIGIFGVYLGNWLSFLWIK